jgi:hypothetical protein
VIGVKLQEGDRIRNILNGKVYGVQKVTKEWVVLNAEDGSSQVLTGKMGLKFGYTWAAVEDGNLSMTPPFPELGTSAR